MIKKYVTKAFEMLCEFGVVVALIYGTIAGVEGDYATLAAAFLVLIAFGMVYILLDIRDNTKRMADAAEAALQKNTGTQAET